jgi:hypothetical protein
MEEIPYRKSLLKKKNNDEAVWSYYQITRHITKIVLKCYPAFFLSSDKVNKSDCSNYQVIWLLSTS